MTQTPSSSQRRCNTTHSASRAAAAKAGKIVTAGALASPPLGLHALATPAVIVDGKNAGFVLAPRVGLVAAGAFAAASATSR